MKCILRNTDNWHEDTIEMYVVVLEQSGFKVTCEMVQTKWGRSPELVIDLTTIAELEIMCRIVGHEVVFSTHNDGTVVVEIYDNYRE